MQSFRKSCISLYCIVFVIMLVLSLSQASAETYQYDPAGRLTKVTYDNGSSITYTYDAAGNITVTETDAAETGHFVLNLKPGWNLISFPGNRCSYEGTEPSGQPNCVEMVDVGSLGFTSLAGWFSSIINSPWEMVIGTNGAMDSSLDHQFHSLKYISPCFGYWVKIDKSVQNAVLSIEGSPFDPSCPIPLKEGWNLVGCPIGKAYYDSNDLPTGAHVPDGTEWVQVNAPVAQQVFGSIMNDCELIISEDGAYNPALPPEFSSLHFVGPGYSYWIKVKKDGNLIYSQ